MAKHYGTFDCGCDGVISLYGNKKDRVSQEEYIFSSTCYACQRAEENEKNLKLSEDNEFPILEGTEKQVAWANTLRMDVFNKINSFVDSISVDNVDKKLEYFGAQGIKFNWYKDVMDNREVCIKLKVQLKLLLSYMIREQVKSTFYIDNRFKSDEELLIYLDKLPIVEAEEKLLTPPEELVLESTVKPKDCYYDGIVQFELTPEYIRLYYVKCDAFIEIVKSNSFRWRYSYWERTLCNLSGSYIDRAAEVGNDLLNAGFSICIMDSDIRQKAIDGDYEREIKYWVLADSENSCLKIYMPDCSDSLYKKARRLPSARWDGYNIKVNLAYYAEVLDFAELNDFKVSEKSQKLIEEYALKEAMIPIVSPVSKVIEDSTNTKLKDILDSEVGVLDDLKD